MNPQQEPPTPEEMQAARDALRESTAEMASAADVHYCEVLEEDTRGWWHGRCACNAKFGPAPDADVVVDDLMQHAYEQGILDERRGRVPR